MSTLQYCGLLAGKTRFLIRRFAIVAAAVVMIMHAGAPAAVADEAEDVAALNYLLLWSGDQVGPVDSSRSTLLNQSIRAFQRRISARPSGRLDAVQLKRLAADAQKRAAGVGYALTDDRAMNSSIGLPKKLVGPPDRGPEGETYVGAASGLTITTHRFQSIDRPLLRVYRSWTALLEGKSLAINSFRGDHFSLLWYDERVLNAASFYEQSGEVRGFAVVLDRTIGQDLDFLVHAMISDFVPFTSTPRAELMRVPRALPNTALEPDGDRTKGGKAERKGSSSGSGFVVSDRGHIVTNAHVVKGCGTIMVGDRGPAQVIAMDQAADLALLRDATRKGGVFARFAEEPTRLGEDVAVFGFPLRTILADQLNMTTGGVSSLAGLGGNTSHLQITAPVQRGNSGGPLVDASGRVLGVVTSKLDALSIASSHGGDLPQAINFAIKSQIVLRFLRQSGLQPQVQPRGQAMKGPELAIVGASFSVPITCAAE